jgi:predicted DNA-binding transcriptional regulator AlpA
MQTNQSIATPVKEPSAPLLNEYQIAEMLNVSTGTICRWRLLHRGPKFLKLGNLVRYREADVLSWLQTRPMGGQQ